MMNMIMMFLYYEDEEILWLKMEKILILCLLYVKICVGCTLYNKDNEMLINCCLCVYISC